MTRPRNARTRQVMFLSASALAAWAVVAGVGSDRGVVMAEARLLSAAPADATSYSLGFDIARHTLDTLRDDGVSFDADSLVQGFSDALRGADPAVADVDMKAALTRLERDVSTRFAQERLKTDPVFVALAQQNAKHSAEMLDRMSKREGAKALDGGIWCIELQPGAGSPPAPTDIVVLTFTVRTADGRVVTEGVGKEVRVSGVIEGGQRALTKMAPGARWLVGIPSDLAFGLGGLPPEIGPNQAVIIDCTLERVER